MGRCKTCIWYGEMGKCRWHACQCPKMIYGYGRAESDPDGLSVEDDEGWGMVPGPEFGCIHHKEKPHE